jgi:hypothetical protein
LTIDSNTQNPDNSGMFKFVADELADAEAKGERVWLLGHVLSGWDGTNPLPNPSGKYSWALWYVR